MITTLLIVLALGSTLVLSGAAIAIWLLPGSSAAMRFSILQIAIVSLLLLPIGVLCLPEVPLGFDLNPRAMKQLDSFSPTVFGDPVSTRHKPTPDVRDDLGDIDFRSPTIGRAVAPGRPADAVDHSRYPVSKTLLMIWLTVSSVLLFRTLFVHARVARQAKLADNEFDLPVVKTANCLPITVDLVCSSWPSVPITVGIRRRRIFLPAAAVNWSADQVRMVLKHELAHVLRRDVLWQLVTSVATSLFWFQPLAWWADRQLSVERERACDDQVISGGEFATDYATVLVQLAAYFSGRTTIPTGALSMAQKPIERRLTTILSPTTPRKSTSRWLGSLATALALLAVVSVCSIRPFAPLVHAAAIQDESERDGILATQDDNVDLANPQSPEVIKPVLVVKTYAVADLVAPSPFRPTAMPRNKTEKPNVDSKSLMELLANTVRTDSWLERGVGGEGTMTFYNPGLTLIVTQVPDVHDEIQDLLNKLRELDDITIDMRGFLTVISDEDLKKSLQRDVSTSPAEIDRHEAKLLYALAFVNESFFSYEFKQVSTFNGQETFLSFPDLDIALTKRLSVQSISTRDRKSVQSVIGFNDVNSDKPEYKAVGIKENGQVMMARVGRTHETVVPKAENGQCMTIDVSSILPADKTGFRAILVLRQYAMDLQNDWREARE